MAAADQIHNVYLYLQPRELERPVSLEVYWDLGALREHLWQTTSDVGCAVRGLDCAERGRDKTVKTLEPFGMEEKKPASGPFFIVVETIYSTWADAVPHVWLQPMAIVPGREWEGVFACGECGGGLDEDDEAFEEEALA
ncbi:uncharacterized protein N7500_001107 [Penicillium coprophilum]|uniref:uncharacterized protein n=1 Tax=Penicillium coprophilum TaxID=36646 RepID=UPI0023A621BA|nr:uncharacterized protein N7500_001107 [Penicillium coprophilum]KAJ5178408.1 hypothetical protein N7500_001107 [Penicillium coprophilum]